jgi:septal ring factor EnvC (AmiA/AmiB activator)
MVRFVFVFTAVFKTLSLAPWCLLFFLGQPVMAESSSDTLEERITREETQREALQERLSGAEKEVEDLRVDEARVLQDLERLNRELHKSRASLRDTRAKIGEIEEQMEILTLEKASLEAQIQTLEAFAVPRLVAFYKLGQLGIASILFSSQSFSQLWQRRQSLERILRHDRELWDTLQDRKRELDAVSQDLQAKKATQDRLLKTGEEQAARITRKKAERSTLLASIQTDKDLALAAIASLKERAKKLDETIKSLERRRSPVMSGTAPKSFAELKGSLPLPVEGQISGPFGPYLHKGDYHIKGYRSGVTIQAALEDPVRAVYDGEVIYAGWFKGYGNIMIIDHGEHYYTLSAPLDEVFKQKGEAVLAGEAIGTFGDMVTLSGPGLYFEVRHHGTPLDPALWFKN